ncbi:hypothetical protein [Actinomadura sp. DC4]|uniref:hypothetical protein n=1 Tax=Actinomadura sp. DC4 TaxID=3055069 RepID=UPI0025B2270B|nr:hypothetical protein [Actinomadura sp. DC4]MDN3356038.1 hypothetical protein [Actinomadura sp. DC4]
MTARQRGTVAVISIWLLLALFAGVVAAHGAKKGQDPTPVLGVLFLGWLFVTPHALLLKRPRRTNREGSR